MHSSDNGWMRTAPERWLAGGDALYASDLCSNDRHMRGGNHGIPAARYIAADRVYRNVPVPKHDTWQGLDFNIQHAVTLLAGKVSHLRLRKLDVFQIALGNFGYCALYLRVC